MNILILEDNCYLLDMIKEDLVFGLKKHNIRPNISLCSNIEMANQYIEEREYDFILCDLNMDPYGLDEKLYLETIGARLTGWVWIKHYVINKGKNSFIIFYSAFIDELKQNKDFIDHTPKCALLEKGIHDSKDICNIIIKQHYSR